MNNKHKNYETDPAKFKRHLKTQLLKMFEAEAQFLPQKSIFPSLLPKLSVVAALLVVAVFANTFFQSTPDAYAFLREAKEQYEQKRAEAGIIKTVSEYKEGDSVYILSLVEDTQKDTAKIKVENQTEGKLIGEVLIKDKKLYSKKDLQEEIKKGLQGSSAAAPLASALTKKLAVDALFFEEAFKKEGLKYEGEINKDSKKLVKLSNGDTEFLFDAKTLAPYEFVAAQEDKEELPDQYKLIEESFSYEAEEETVTEDWQEIRFNPREEFRPTIQNLEDLVYKLEIYEEKLRNVDPGNREEVDNIIRELQDQISSLNQSERLSAHGNKSFEGENLDEEKSHILEFLQYAKREKGQNVTDLVKRVKAARTHEELEALGETVEPQLQRIYEQSPFVGRFEEHKAPQNDSYRNDEGHMYRPDYPNRRGQQPENEGYKPQDNGQYRNAESMPEDLKTFKMEIKTVFDEAQKQGIDTGPYYQMVEKAASIEELEALENQIPAEIKVFFDKYEEQMRRGEGSDYKRQDPGDSQNYSEDYQNRRQDYRNGEYNDKDRPGTEEKDIYDEVRENEKPERESINDESNEEGYKGSDQEYGRKVQQILDELAVLREEGVQTEHLYNQLSNARRHEDLDKLIFDLSKL